MNRGNSRVKSNICSIEAENVQSIMVIAQGLGRSMEMIGNALATSNNTNSQNPDFSQSTFTRNTPPAANNVQYSPRCSSVPEFLLYFYKNTIRTLELMSTLVNTEHYLLPVVYF